MSEVVAVILVIAVLLALVSLMLPLADRYGLPYTTLLAALGLGLGFLAVAVGHRPELGILGDVLNGLTGIDLSAEAFLLLFLPPLLFTAGLTIDVRLLFDEFAAVLRLAVIAVVVSTAAVGYALNAITEFGLIACLLLGAIVATTDPAAVISIFRDLGAPRRLTTLVAGESLFNDAAAIAIFTLLLEVLVGFHQLEVTTGVLVFLTDFTGGLAVGYVMSRGACALLNRLRNTAVAEITVTVSLAYLTYIVAETYLDVSGVIAVVTAALTFAVYGRTSLRAGSWEPLVQTWHQLEFWANSLIFLLTAVLATRVVPEAGPAEIALLAVLVVSTLAARAAVLYGLLPFLSVLRLTQPVEPRFQAVILWGGLRGAVTMVLALSVSQNEFVPPAVQNFVAVLAIGYVLFTLFIGAPTLRPLLKLLGVDKLSATELALRNRVMALSRSQIREQIGEVARDYGFAPELVMRVAPEPDEDAIDKKPTDAGDAEDASEAAHASLPKEARLRVGLLTLANREKELYLSHFSNATLSRRIASLRVAASDRLIDRVKTAGVEGYQEASAEDVRLTPASRLALWLHRRFGYATPLARSIAERFDTLLATELVIRELRRFNRRALRPLLGTATSGAVAELLGRRLELVGDALSAIELQYPAFAESLRTHYLARAELRFEDNEYRRKLEESLISREVFNDLQRELSARRQDLARRPPLDLGLALTEMIKRVSAFEGLEPERLRYIAQLLRPRLAMPQELIVRSGRRGSAMYFIASGRVEVLLPNGVVPLGPGDFFGELALMTARPRTADVRALGYCHLLVLDRRDFQRLLRSDPGLKARIESVAEQRLDEFKRRKTG